MPSISFRPWTPLFKPALMKGTPSSLSPRHSFLNLVRLGFSDYASYQALTAHTDETWRSGADAIAQGRYEAGPITCISDIVSRDGGGFVLTEIKSGTSAKPEHTFDLAFQRVVLEKSGFPIVRCEVAHVNRDYVRAGEIDPRELVAVTDITEEVSEQVENTKARIDEALSVVARHTRCLTRHPNGHA